MGSITLCELAEQYKLCEAKLKRFDKIGSQDLDNIFKPPVSFAIHSKTPDNQEKSSGSDNKKIVLEMCPWKSFSQNTQVFYFQHRRKT